VHQSPRVQPSVRSPDPQLTQAHARLSPSVGDATMVRDRAPFRRGLVPELAGCSLRYLIADGDVTEPAALKTLAAWYRKYAERTDNPDVWHARLATAELLERETDRLQDRINCNRYPDGAATEEIAPRQANEMFAEDEGT
jgi:hypothetical protein